VLWLLLFLGTASLIVARQGAALRTSRQLLTLQDSARQLEAARANLIGRIQHATSLEVLVPKMERAGMHQPSDTEQSFVRLDTVGAGAPRKP
jgi:hypothetical protein